MIKFNYKKGTLQRAIFIIIGVLITISLIAAAVAYLLPKNPTIKDGDIKIGDITITKKRIDDYSKIIADYKKSHPEALLDGDTASIASDDLIMNSALKYYAKKYNQVVSSEDVLAAAYISLPSGQDADAFLLNKLGGESSMGRIRNENLAYQKKLAKYVLLMKSLFVIRLSFDTPYFANLPRDDVQAAYDASRARLENDFLPMFKSKLSKEDIANRTDVNSLDSDYSDDQDYQKYANGLVVNANMDSNYRADGAYYNNIDTTGYIRGDVGKLFNMDEKITTLKNVGDHTPVFASKTGEFAIVRLESKTKGEFNSWQDMLKYFKSKYAYDGLSSYVSDISYGTQNFLDNSFDFFASLGTDKVFADVCDGHRITYHVRSIDSINQVRIAGTSMHFRDADNYAGACGESAHVNFSENYTTSVGADTLSQTYDCNGRGVYYKKTADPSGYNYLSTVSPYINGTHPDPPDTGPDPYVSGVSNLNQEYSNGGGGFPKWTYNGMNRIGNVYINFFYSPASDWQLADDTKITSSSDSSVVSFEHYLQNNGPTATDKSINYDTRIKRVAGSISDNITEDQVVNSTAVLHQKTNYDNIASGFPVYNGTAGTTGWFNATETAHTITDADLDSWICGYITASPQAEDNDNWLRSYECRFIPYNYNLHPSVSLNPDSVIEAGSQVTVTPKVANDGPTKTRDTDWKLTKIILEPGTTKPSGSADSTNDPCGTFFRLSGMTCSDAGSGKSVFSVNGTVSSGDPLSAVDTTADDLDIGSKICFALSLKPRSSGSANWVHSTPVCVVIGGKPKTQVWGGDLVSGDKVQTSASVKLIGSNTTGSTFGSWVEYAIFSKGTITGMASNSALNSDTGLANNAGCNYSRLTFTGGVDSSCTTKGNYSVASVPDLAANFPDTNNNINVSSIAPNSLASGTYMRSGDLTLTQSELSPGKSVILKVSGTVTISKNQTYNLNNNGSGYTLISQLPQLVIIANKIIINNAVSQVDAWLVASGVIETCDTRSLTYALSGSLNLDSTKCNVKLTVNGPVVANQLWLRRTAGSGKQAASDDPAEVFNLRADTFLWASARSFVAGRIRTVYTTELPPRF